MSDYRRGQRRVPLEQRPDVRLPDGRTLRPRIKFAGGVGISDKTAARMNLPTVYIGGVAYVDLDSSLECIGDAARPRKRPGANRRPAA
jgi:hypothetical protein